jgi:hypothetical protein
MEDEKYHMVKKEELFMLIVMHQKMLQFYKDKELKGRLSKEEIQGSKMHLLNVIFSIGFYDSIVTMNDRKSRPKLDEGGAGRNNKTWWAEFTEAYNDSVNDDAYRSYAFVEDEHIEGIVSKYDLCN